MALTFWWLGLPLLLALIGIVAYRLLRGRGRTEDGLLAANTDRLRATPRYQALAKRYLTWLLVQVACVALAALGSVALVSRLGTVTTIEPELRNRDIVLCLDVSGSMMEIDAELMKGYQQIAEGLQKERVSLVIFDSSAATVFPLTNDYAFVKDELVRGEKAMRSSRDYTYRSGTREGSGSSLIPDGIMSCLDRFDQLDHKRPRTLVVATDNLVSGRPIFTLDDCGNVATERGVMIYAIAPDLWKGSKELRNLENLAKRTGGGLTTVKDKNSSQQIVDAISKQEAANFKGAPQRLVHDQPAIGATLLALGVAGALLASWRMRR